MGHIYISYSRADADTAVRFRSALQAQDYSVWLDTDHLAAGDAWSDQIEQAIRDADVFVVLLSRRSVVSRTIGSEILLALKLQLPIIPLVLESVPMPSSLANRQFIDASGEWEVVVNKLTQGIDVSMAMAQSRRQTAAPTPTHMPRSPEQRAVRARVGQYLILLMIMVFALIVVVLFASGGDDARVAEFQSADIPSPDPTTMVLTATFIGQGSFTLDDKTATVEDRESSGRPTATLTSERETTMSDDFPTIEFSLEISTIGNFTQGPEATPTPTAANLSAVEQTATALAEILSPPGGSGTSTPIAGVGGSSSSIPTSLPLKGGGEDFFGTAVAQSVDATMIALAAAPSRTTEAAVVINNTNTTLLAVIGVVAALSVGFSGAMLVMLWTGGGQRPRRRTSHPSAHHSPHGSQQTGHVPPEPLLEEYQIFISSSDKDKEWITTLVEDLTALSYLVWWYAKDAPGLPFGNEIRSAIYHTKVFVIILSGNAMQSKHVEEEIRWAEIYDRPIIPVLYSEIAVEERLYGLAKGADIDFTDDRLYGASLEFLAQAIDHHLKQRLEALQIANIEM